MSGITKIEKVPKYLIIYQLFNWDHFIARNASEAFFGGIGATSASVRVRTHGQHFTRNTARGAGEQFTITVYHHHEGAPLTVALMPAKGISDSSVARVAIRAAKFIENSFYSESN